MRKEIRLVSFLTMIALLMGMPYAFAGDKQPTTMDAATIDKFVAVYSDVQLIQQKYSQKLQTATSQEDAQTLQQQAQEEMVQAIEANGVSVEEYNTMVQTVTSNPELMAEVEKRLENQLQ